MLLADNTKSFQEISKEVAQQAGNQQELQQQIYRISQWAKDWKMEIYPAKSIVLHIGENKSWPALLDERR